MDASFQILRDHSLNYDRSKAGQKPANCLWLWGQGRTVFWPSFSERFKTAGVVVSQSDVHRGLGIMAGLEAADGVRLAGADLRAQATIALEELKKKRFCIRACGFAGRGGLRVRRSGQGEGYRSG